MLITVNDRASYQITSREVTDEGFLRVPGHVAKVGTQDYLASELGLEGDPLRIVTVYRPESEVFNAKSLSSYDGVDITLEHPDTFVNSSNYSKVSKGIVRGSGVQDGNLVKCELIVKDQETIDLINSGKGELSAGYSALYVHEPGTTLDGVKYDFIQKDIVINHVAIVDRARAGREARIFDNEGIKMKKLKINDSEFEVPEAVATYVQKLTADKDKVEAERDADRAEVKRLKEERKEDDYDVENLRKKVREMEDEKEEGKKKEAVKDAQVLVGDSAKTFDSAKTAIDVKREALVSMGYDVQDRQPAYIEARFDSELAHRHTADAQHGKLGRDFTNTEVTDSDPNGKIVTDSRSKYLDRLTGRAK